MTVELRAVCDLCGEGGPVLDGQACTPGEAIVAAGLIHDGPRLVCPHHDVMSEEDQHAAQAELERFWPEDEYIDPAERDRLRDLADEWDLRDRALEASWEAAMTDPRDYL